MSIKDVQFHLVGDEALAAAVIQRAVADVEHGTPAVRQEAISDIVNGGLEYWVEALSYRWDIYDSLQERLWRLVGVAESA